MCRKLLPLLASFILASCGSSPVVEEAAPAEVEPPEVVETVSEVETAPEVPEEPVVVEEAEELPTAEEAKALVKEDVAVFVEALNKIIRNKKYNEWLEYLEPEYLERISSRAFLDEASEAQRFKAHNIHLRDAQDYFYLVVVPAYANVHVDDIDIIAENRVRAYAIRVSKGKTARVWLYELIRDGDTWKIVNS